MAQEQDSSKSEQILEAASRLMRQKSFKDLSMDELAAEAGVAKGTLYLYFRSKGEIYLSLLLKGASGLGELMFEVEKTPGQSALEKLETILNGASRFIQNKPHSYIPILAMPGTTPEEIEDDLQERFFPLLDDIKDKLAGIFRKGIRSRQFRKLDPRRLAGVFIHLLEYCYVQSILLADEPTDPADEIPFIKELFFKGILA